MTILAKPGEKIRLSFNGKNYLKIMKSRVGRSKKIKMLDQTLPAL